MAFYRRIVLFNDTYRDSLVDVRDFSEFIQENKVQILEICRSIVGYTFTGIHVHLKGAKGLNI